MRTKPTPRSKGRIMGPSRTQLERARARAREAEDALREALPILERFSRRFTSMEKSMIAPGLDDVVVQVRRALGEEDS